MATCGDVLNGSTERHEGDVNNDRESQVVCLEHGITAVSRKGYLMLDHKLVKERHCSDEKVKAGNG